MPTIELKSEEIILKAVKVKASDVHIIPSRGFTQIKFRVGHRLIEYEKWKNEDAEKLISHFKFRSKMDIGERRRPQNGSLIVIIDNQQINLRISTLPTQLHESVSIRLLPQSDIETLSKLTLFQKQADQLQALLNKAYGLLLISGPTGSGKTTTIYSLLNNQLNRQKRIITLEDPIEKRTDFFIQVEINEKAGLNFSEALKATLRHDPDIIMIGEIRDEKTAKIAVRAAMTGHLVISTIHANNSMGCITRLKEFGIADNDIRETVIGLVSQRLVERTCPYCLGICSNSCLVYSEKQRLAVFEIIAGDTLKQLLFSPEKHVTYEALSQVINKGIALGFVNEKEYERWLS